MAICAYLSFIVPQLLSTLPDLFDCRSAETFELALQIVASYHYRRRNAYKHKIEMTVHFPKNSKSVAVVFDFHFILDIEFMPSLQPTKADSNQQTESNAHSPKKRKLVMSVSVVFKFHFIIYILDMRLMPSLQPTRTASEREREAEENRKEIIIIDLTLDNHEKQKDDVEFIEPKLPLTMDISNRLSGRATIKRSHSESPRPSALRSPTALINSQNTPLHAESSSQARSSKSVSFEQGNHEDVFQLTGVTRVARFLNACSPSMAHFLQPFIAFGCTSEEYLVTVSTWPPDKISHFLSRVVHHRKDGQEFSPMEMLTLQNHFTSYFDKAQT